MVEEVGPTDRGVGVSISLLIMRKAPRVNKYILDIEEVHPGVEDTRHAEECSPSPEAGMNLGVDRSPWSRDVVVLLMNMCCREWRLVLKSRDESRLSCSCDRRPCVAADVRWT